MNDKEFIKMYAAVILYTLGIIGITIAACYMWHSMHPATPETKVEYVYCDKEIDIDTLVEAIIFVESKGNNKAVGDNGKSVGCM